MSKGKMSICFMLSLIVVGFTFLTYGEAVENTLMQMANAGTMPEKYLSSDGWVFDYAPVEHFMILSIGFVVLYYGGVGLMKSQMLGKVLIGLYLAGFVLVTMEFWQLIGVTLLPMVFLCGMAIYNLKKQVMQKK